MKLNLGCCDSLLDGYVNIDKVPGPGVEVVDLTRPWPWPENSVDHVRAWDIFEHLADKIFTMNELWRVLKPAGTVEISIPTTDGTGAFQDPTHVSFWNRRSFLYYEDGNSYHERFAHYYGIQAKFRVKHERAEGSIDGPRLTILLEAVKLGNMQWPQFTSGDLRLNLNSCESNLEGFVNCDIFPAPGVEAINFQQRWPWQDNSVAFVRASDFIEHLPNKLFTMEEFWRVLAPGGNVEITVPTTDGPGAFQDPTHVSFWNRRSFSYYEEGNFYRERFVQFYGIRAKFRVLHEQIVETIDGPQLNILLEAIKV